MRRTRITLGVIVLMAMQGAPAQAASGDPYVVYAANRQVGGPVVLRANPATGAVSEVSRNGSQGRYFVHPYDLAVERDGSLLVVDMGAFAIDRRQRVADGAVIRVDPATGRQSMLSRGGALVDPAGIAIAPGGTVYVVENVGTTGFPGVIRIDPRSGAQTRVAEGGALCNPFGVALEADGGLVVSDYGDLVSAGGITVIDCPLNAGSLVRVPTDRRAPALLASAGVFGSPFGVAVEPGGRILVANEDAVEAGVFAVDPNSGLQSVVTRNVLHDAFRFPQRIARTPDGNLLVTDFQLTDGNGGIVHVARSGGAQRVLWQGRPFDNPLGIAVVINRPPRAALRVAPNVVAGERPVSFDASGSADPEGRPLRYDWDLDGDGTFEARSASPTVARRYQGSAAITARVRVTDRHGSTAQAGAPLSVDATAPRVARFRVSSRTLLGRAPGPGARAYSLARPRRKVTFRYRLSERARMAIALAQARPGRRAAGRCRPVRWSTRSRPACTRWRRRVTLRQLGVAGPNKLVFRGRVRGRRLPAGRYRATAVGADRVGNRSLPRRLRMRVVAPPS